MEHAVEIGKIHPSFFECSPLFKGCDTISTLQGEITLKSPFFVLDYSLDTGLLKCEDKDVLLDFTHLIKESYGSNLQREDIKACIDIDSVKREWSVLNVAICILNDSSGWDGSPNAVYFDGESPGLVVEVVAQFWSTRMLLDSWKLEEPDIVMLGGSVVLPNLFEALAVHKKDKERHRILTNLIKQVQYAY